MEIANVLLRHRRVVVALPVALAALVVGIVFLLPRSYSSSVSFVPEAEQTQASRLSGIAAQFGMNIGSFGSGRSPQFYADLLRSRELLEAVAHTQFEPTEEDAAWDAGTLLQLYQIEGETIGLRESRAVDRLRDDLSVETKPETGVVRYTIAAPWPGLARQIADRVVELVNEFNLETRQTQAAAERRFLEDRLQAAEEDLRAAEDSLEAFLDRNRSYQSSPALRFEHDRLQRQVSLEQQVVTSLAQSYEQARIDEVRDTPVITVIESAQIPPQPDRRWLLVKGFIAGLIGLLMAAMWAFGRDFYADTGEEQPREYERFRELLAETRAELLSVMRKIRAPFSRSSGR